MTQSQSPGAATRPRAPPSSAPRPPPAGDARAWLQGDPPAAPPTCPALHRPTGNGGAGLYVDRPTLSDTKREQRPCSEVFCIKLHLRKRGACAKSWHVAFVQHSRMVSRVLRPAFHSHPRISSSPKSCKTGISFHFTDPKTESPPSQPCPAPRSWCEAETRDSNTSQCSAQVRWAHAAPGTAARTLTLTRTHTHSLPAQSHARSHDLCPCFIRR